MKKNAILFSILTLIALCCVALLRPAQAQETLWQDVSAETIRSSGERFIVPNTYRLVRVNLAQLETSLAVAPLATEGEAVVLELPLPNGGFGRFNVHNAPIMEPALAARYPELQTYTAQGIDDPTATGRLSLTPLGFRAFIQSAYGTTYIDPYQTNDVTHYISYDKTDYINQHGQFVETVRGTESKVRVPNLQQAPPTGDTKITYTIAIAAAAEYADFICTQGGDCSTATAKRATAMDAIVIGMNRVTQIYERDVTVSFVIVEGNDQLVFTDQENDPFSDGTDAETIDNELGGVVGDVLDLADYDLGHGIGSGGGTGGLAGIFQCDGTTHASKASGATTANSPIGDPFWVDFFSHEIGHQFGADHSYNASAGGSCTTRVAGFAYEPASGTTIMSYTGICAAQDLQPQADAMFNAGAISQIVEHITNGDGSTCGVDSATGNTAPTVEAGGNFTIPAETPFMLTATLSDNEQATSAITTSWEQFNLGTSWPNESLLPNTDEQDDTVRPLFRVYLPSSSPTRIFPALASILSGDYGNNGEDLPSIDQTMTFRAVARDNAAGGGGVNHDDMQVTVDSASGPFYVNSQDADETLAPNDSITVDWDVAGTNAAPVNCANVDIELSLDNAQTFTEMLLAGTPNDGMEDVTIPNVSTTEGRIRVKCSNNIFFDLSAGQLTITGTPTAVNLQNGSASSTGIVVLVTIAFASLVLVTLRWRMVASAE